MNWTKLLGLVIISIACTGLVFGSFGYTSASADRNVSVQVTNDDHAFIGYQSSDLAVEDNETIDLVTLENRFSHSVDVTDITINDGSFTLSNPTQPINIHPGEHKTIRGTVECTPNETQKIELTVTLKGSSVTAQIFGDTETREFTLTCAPE